MLRGSLDLDIVPFTPTTADDLACPNSPFRLACSPLKDIFAGTNWESYDRGAPFGDPHDAYAGGLVFQRNGPEWRQARAMFDRTFTTPAVRSYVPILNHLRDVFMEQLEKTAKESGDKGFDIQPLLSRFTFE